MHWIKAENRPEPYTLCLLCLKDESIKPGWWTGQHWDGRRLKKEDVVLAYKKADWQTNNVGYSLDKRR
jgi:hypothetical protein